MHSLHTYTRSRWSSRPRQSHSSDWSAYYSLVVACRRRTKSTVDFIWLDLISLYTLKLLVGLKPGFHYASPNLHRMTDCWCVCDRMASQSGVFACCFAEKQDQNPDTSTTATPPDRGKCGLTSQQVNTIVC